MRKLAPIVSTAFDTRERPRRLPITLSEKRRRASWAPTGGRRLPLRKDRSVA